MQRVAIDVVSRPTGKTVAKRFRAEGNIPAIVYGKIDAPKAVFVKGADLRAIEKMDHSFNVLIDLTIDGQNKTLARICDYQADALYRKVTHLDLQAIDINQKIDVEVPVRLVGTPPGVKDDGGMLEQFRHTLHVVATPNSIPSVIEVDISSLRIGDNIHVDDLKLPEGVSLPHASNYTIAAVVAPQKEEEVVAAPAADAAAATPGAAPTAPGAAPAAAPAADAGKKAEKK